eukprot:TRINITY_DN2834_c0_g1_i1.p3 TRINITY_DN2834_c0_g1~~TRINITY_DN2834_c0_g1_i1.p3  ORF type:complete len:113 (+),score=1.83 TRINITY_DN2834_c0_g1_i1:248-586(+)
MPVPLAVKSETPLPDRTPVGADHVVSVRDLTHVVGTDRVFPVRDLDAVFAVVVVAVVVAAAVGEGAAAIGVGEVAVDRTESAVEWRHQGAGDSDGGDRVGEFVVFIRFVGRE